MSTMIPGMPSALPRGAAGFLGPRDPASLLCRIFAAGIEAETRPDYRWDGMTRGDGPLYLLQYTLAGSGCLEVQGELHRLDPGRLMMLAIPGKHCYFLPPESASWEFAWLLVHQENLAPFWKDIQVFLGPVADLSPENPAISCLLETASRVVTGEAGDAWLRSGLVYRLFMELLSQGADRRKSPPPDMPPGIARVLAALDRDFMSLQDLDDLAKLAIMSRYHFQRQFRQHTGHTPGEYLARLRIARAMDLLREGSLEVAAVARACGFNSSSYFIKAFRQHTGLTPGDFRLGITSLPGSRISWHH